MNIQDLNSKIVDCRKCPRLVAWRKQAYHDRPKRYRNSTYWARPVSGFGDIDGRVLIVGLAPGAHGANRTGRSFTGDGASNFLFRALHYHGFANQATSSRVDDDLVLKDLYITNAVKCAPPDNKPERDEIENCLPYLNAEFMLMKNLQIIVALGRIAFDTINKNKDIKFEHDLVVQFTEKVWLMSSYHPSRQNTQTHKLTEQMFDDVWFNVRDLLK